MEDDAEMGSVVADGGANYKRTGQEGMSTDKTIGDCGGRRISCGLS